MFKKKHLEDSLQQHCNKTKEITLKIQENNPNVHQQENGYIHKERYILQCLTMSCNCNGCLTMSCNGNILQCLTMTYQADL